jgi:hypothetical protein
VPQPPITPRHDHVAGYGAWRWSAGCFVGARHPRDCGVYLRRGDRPSGALRLIERVRPDAARRWIKVPCGSSSRAVSARVCLLNLDNHLNFHRTVGRKCPHSHAGACVLLDLPYLPQGLATNGSNARSLRCASYLLRKLSRAPFGELELAVNWL